MHRYFVTFARSIGRDSSTNINDEHSSKKFNSMLFDGTNITNTLNEGSKHGDEMWRFEKGRERKMKRKYCDDIMTSNEMCRKVKL